MHTSPPQPNLEDLVWKYINLVNAGDEEHGKSTSIHNMENQIELLAKMIAERPFGSLPSELEQTLREQAKAVILQSIQDQAITSPMILDEEEKIVQTKRNTLCPRKKGAY